MKKKCGKEKDPREANCKDAKEGPTRAQAEAAGTQAGEQNPKNSKTFPEVKLVELPIDRERRVNETSTPNHTNKNAIQAKNSHLHGKR